MRGHARAQCAPCAPKVHHCRKGHVMTYISTSDKYICNTCARRRQRAKYEAQRQRRLKERRRRIAARPRPGRVVRIWAAGHFEGEGTLSIVRYGMGNGTRPVATLTSTDRSMVDVFQTHWPGYLQSRVPPNPNAREQFTWTLYGLDQIEGFVLDIQPYFKSARVRAKAALLLEDIRARAAQHRTPEARAARAERVEKMRALNRRGV